MDLECILAKFRSRTPSILGSENFSKYAVLLPLVDINGKYHILFEVRALKMRRQPGEVCFPGGKMDPDDVDSLHTAMRETSEELGIEPENIKNVLPLDYLLSPFGMIIYPYMGVIERPDAIRPNPNEVDEVFMVPLSFLLETGPEVHKINHRVETATDFPYEAIAGGKDYKWQAREAEEYFYYYEDKVIWGLTARLLKHFIDVIGK